MHKSIHDKIALVGTVITFLLFLKQLPIWSHFRWLDDSPWRRIGIHNDSYVITILGFLRGFLISLILLALLLISLLLTPWVAWGGLINFNLLVNAFALGFGVAFAEELIFRGWLFEELSLLFGIRMSLLIQAIIFSILHSKLNIDFLPSLFLLFGLFLLGLVLGQLRVKAEGSLWVPIGLHSGLVSGWFLIESGLLSISSDAPIWILGPGSPASSNPIGGAFGISFLCLILVFQRDRI